MNQLVFGEAPKDAEGCRAAVRLHAGHSPATPLVVGLFAACGVQGVTHMCGIEILPD